MALTKSQKQDVINEVAELLGESKMTVVAKYQGIDVKALQSLRKDARENGTKVKIVKNRLVKQALLQTDKFQKADSSTLEGMLLYAFNSVDEVAAAQVLSKFAKTNPTLEFVGGFSGEGEFVSSDNVKALAALPGKNQMIAGLINTLNAPLRGVTSSLGSNLHGILSGLEAKASN